MARCAVGQGFFTRRPCQNPADNLCPVCTKVVCDEHGLQTPEGWRCFVCNSKAGAATAGARPVPAGGGRRFPRTVANTDGFFDPYYYRSSYWSTRSSWGAVGPSGGSGRDVDGDGDIDGDDADYGSLFDS